MRKRLTLIACEAFAQLKNPYKTYVKNRCVKLFWMRWQIYSIETRFYRRFNGDLIEMCANFTKMIIKYHLQIVYNHCIENAIMWMNSTVLVKWQRNIAGEIQLIQSKYRIEVE